MQPNQNVTTGNYEILASQKTFWFYDSFGLQTLGANPAPSIEPQTVDAANITGHVGGLTNSTNDYAAVITDAFESDPTSFPSGRGFFIDSLYMVGGQISSSNYAKSSGRTWMGRQDDHGPFSPQWGQLVTGSEYNAPSSGGFPAAFTNNEDQYGWGVGNALTFGTLLEKDLLG